MAEPDMGPEPAILLATRSRGKLVELRRMFEAAGLRICDLEETQVPPSPLEDGLERFDSFEQNARAKARYFHSVTGLPTVADDSGLILAALGSVPGVRSKRWSGRPDLSGAALDEANNALLRRTLETLEDWRARYVCVAVYVDDVREIGSRGEVQGTMRMEPRGMGGFGYDPYFVSVELGKTFAEASAEEKDLVSHRGRAFGELIAVLRGPPPLTEISGRDSLRGSDGA